MKPKKRRNPAPTSSSSQPFFPKGKSTKAPFFKKKKRVPYASAQELKLENKGIGAKKKKLGPVMTPDVVRYRFGLTFKVKGNIKDADFGTKINMMMEDWSPKKSKYWINAKPATKAKHQKATLAWTKNKEKFINDATKDMLVGKAAKWWLVESGSNWAKVADGVGGAMPGWALGAQLRYTVKAWLKGTDGKKLSLKFWVSLWASRKNGKEAFKLKQLTLDNIPTTVKG